MNTLQHAFRSCDTSRLAKLFYSMYLEEREDKTPGLECVERLIEELKSAEAKGTEGDTVILISDSYEDSLKACTAYTADRFKKAAFAKSYPTDRVPDDELQRMGTDELTVLLDRLRAVPTPESRSFFDESDLYILGYDLPDTVIETYGLEKALSIILYEMTWFGWSLDEMEIEKYRYHFNDDAPLPDEFFRHDQDIRVRALWEKEWLALSPEEQEEQKRRDLLAAIKSRYRDIQLADRVAKEIGGE